MVNITHKETGKVLRRVAGTTLAGANLAGAELCGADLHYAVLNGTEFRLADLHLASLLESDLVGAHLEHANLRGADLRGADLRGADLTNADLEGADLREANLAGANLRSTRMRDACLWGTVFTDALYDQDTRWPLAFRADAHGAKEAGPPASPGPIRTFGGKQPGLRTTVPTAPRETLPFSEEPDWENEGGSVRPSQREPEVR